MRYAILRDNATRDEIIHEINRVRAIQLASPIGSTRTEIADEIDEMVERLATAE